MNATARWFATGFGIGFLPRAPGTWASLAALPLAWAIGAAWGVFGLAAAAAGAFLAGWWASRVYLLNSATHDPAEVVIDEIAGQWIALAFAPREVFPFVVAFALFRLFDIWKPWPIRWADRAVPGALGVMLDDVLAGAAAAAGLAILMALL